MLKKSLLSLAIAAGLGLAGCSGTDSSGDVDSNGGNPNQRGADQGSIDLIDNPGTYPIYDPASSAIPIPNDILYSDTSDGTLVFSGETLNSFKFVDPDTNTTGTLFNPITNAIADLDGASISGQIDLPFSGAIDADTVIANRTVFLVPLEPCQDSSGSDLDPVSECLASSDASPNAELAYIDPDVATDSTLIANSFGSAVSFRAEVLEQNDAEGNTVNVLRISPLEPLDGVTRYMVFLTNGIKTTSGESVNPSYQYNAIGGDEVIPVALDGVRSLIQGYESLASGYVATALSNDLADLALSDENIGLLTDLGVDPTSIVDAATAQTAVLAATAATPSAVVMSYSFTTGGTNEVLSAMAAPGVANSALKQDHALDSFTGDDLLAAVGGDATLAAGVEALRNLPAPKARTVTMKAGAQDLGFGAVVHAGTVSLPYYLTAPSFYQDLTAAADPVEQLTAANVVAAKWQSDASLATDLNNSALTAPSTNVTRLFPFAAETGTLDAPVTVYLPADVNNIQGTVIYQHGITTNRSVSAPISTQLIAAGYAVVAMDLAVHGLEPDNFVDSNGLIDYTSTGAKLSPLSSTVVDATAVAAVVLGSNGALTDTAVNNTVAAVNADPTALADATVASIYSSYSTAVLGQYMLSENHFGLTLSADGRTPRAISAEDISLDSGQDDSEGNDIFVTPTGETADESNESGSMFVYLLHHQITRDNLRQSVMNLLNLGASLGNISIDHDSDANTADVTLPTAAGQVHFVGHSLGSIVGTSYVSVNNTVGYYNVNNNLIALGAIAQLDTGNAGLNALFQGTLTAALGSNHLACDNASTFISETLQPLEDDADNGIPAGTVAAVAASDDVQSLNALGCGNNALPHIQTATLANGGSQLTKLLENSPSFAPSLIPGLAASSLTQTSRNFETFMNIFQATIDSVDPMALASGYSSPVLTSTTGVLHIEVENDTVVPNGADDDTDLPYIYRTAPLDSSALTGGAQAFPAPLAGTEPLTANMNLTNVNATTIDSSPIQVAVRFTSGTHSSFGMGSFLTTPELVDSEMATQVVSLITGSGGATVPGYSVAVGTAASGAGASVIETQTTP